MFLAREITRAKWDRKEGFSESEIPADAVTANLRSTSNALSFWSVESDSDEEVREGIEDIALVMAVGRNRVDKIELVWLSYEELRDQGILIQQSKGKTNVADMVDRHYDLCQLDYCRLGKIARLVASALADGRYKRLTRPRVSPLLAEAVEQKRLELAALEEKVQDEVLKEMEKSSET